MIWSMLFSKWKHINWKQLRFLICYPIQIIPKINFKTEINFQDCTSEDKFIIIVRRSDKKYNETFDEFGHLKEDALEPEVIPNLSMNTLGCKFKIRHLKYRVRNPASKDWEGEKISYSLYSESFEILKKNVPIYFRLSDIHKKEFPFKLGRTTDKAKHYIKMLGMDPGSKEEEVRLKGCLEIKHTPNKLNYWHVDLKLIDPEHKPIKSGGSAWGKTAAEFALRDLITYSAKPSFDKSKLFIFKSRHYLINN